MLIAAWSVSASGENSASDVRIEEESTLWLPFLALLILGYSFNLSYDGLADLVM